MTGRKKILWLASWYPNREDPFDGDFVQRHARVAAMDHDIHVISVHSVEGEEEPGEERIQEGGLTEQRFYVKAGNGAFSRLAKQVRERKLWKKAIRDYIEKNGLPAVVHVQVPWKAGLWALWLKRRYKVPYLVTEHWGGYNIVLKDNISTKPFYMRSLLKQVFANCSRLVSVSHFLARGVNSLLAEVPYTVLPNVVDTALFRPGQPEPAFTFIHISNMVALKNVEGILKAFQGIHAKRPEARLILVGNRDEHYPQLAGRMGLPGEAVSFRGELPHAAVAGLLGSAHCLVLNSQIENSPCVIGEALCCGVPVIATRVGGIPELVGGGNGLLVEPDAPDQLQSAMETIMLQYRDFDRLKTASEAAARFGIKAVSGQFREVYQPFSPPPATGLTKKR